jgi:hypothetical protein
LTIEFLLMAAHADANAGLAVGGSFLCESWELRITARCLIEDLRVAPDVGFESIMGHPIVHAFHRKRWNRVEDTKTIGPADGDQTVYRLQGGERERGATWWDSANRVVWLCGSRRHTSSAEDDAFPYFKELMDQGRLLPTAGDVEAFLNDRAERLSNILPEAAQELLQLARANPMKEVTGLLADANVGVLVEIVETLEATYVAIIGARSRHEIYAILAAFFGSELFEWTFEPRLPTRDLDMSRFESCWSILHGEA